MAWIPLAKRLSGLPLMLAGPILRQVTRDAVTVWVALQRPADITLTVYDSDNEVIRKTLMSNKAHPAKTTAVGKKLHIVAVTARAKNALTEGQLYFYDLEFSSVGPPPMQMNLAQAVTKPGENPDPKQLAYFPTFKLPSFALPPSDLNNLRLVHGSCRKAHGGGEVAPDTMAILDRLIEDTASKPLERPHQLLLTGDQIYADEVEDALLVAVTDAGDTLLGWQESMPGVGEAAKLPPTTRSAAIINAGFTSDDTRSHLMSLGEYLAMYLFSWSDVIWTDLPTLAELKNMAGVSIDDTLGQEIESNRKAIANFRKALPSVRRALANVPTYMICDDHEVTDDWNMTRKFCEQVYRPLRLGVRIVQNGLIAFAICQAWGNVPEQFAEDPKLPAGYKLLNALEGISKATADNASRYNALDAYFMQIVGVHNLDDMHAVGGHLRVFHEIYATDKVSIEGISVSTSSLRYHFSVEGPSHQIIVTDTRTWRWFLGPESAPDLLISELSRQLTDDVPALDNRLLMVVLTTNAPPIATIRLFVANAPKSYLYKYDLVDSWEFPSLNFDRLIVALSNKFLTNRLNFQGDTLTGRVIFLSGDVHFSFSSRLAYWADKERLDDLTGHGQKTKLVVAQLVSSSLKNEQEKTRGEQLVGYSYLPPQVQKILSTATNITGLDFADIAKMIFMNVPEAYVGWNIKLGDSPKKVGRSKPGIIKSGMRLEVTGLSPTLTTNINYDKNVRLTAEPDYSYRLDYLKTSEIGQRVPSPPAMPQPNSADLPGSARSIAKAASAHRDLEQKGATKPDCVGYNNIGEIRFVWQVDQQHPEKSNQRVLHTLRWHDPQDPSSASQPYYARYNVSLNIDDQAYPQIKADIDI